MNEAKNSVLLTLSLLGVTNAPKAAYENVNGGKEAWDELVNDALIVKDEFWRLSDTGRAKVRELLRK